MKPFDRNVPRTGAGERETPPPDAVRGDASECARPSPTPEPPHDPGAASGERCPTPFSGAPFSGAKPLTLRAVLANDLVQVARGFCMGAADTVPGVSGGTVALVLGHYQRLVTAVSRIDLEFLGMIRRGKFAVAARHADVRFLVSLAIGIVLGVGLLAGLMHWLLENRLPETFAVFFGLILGSVVLVRRQVDRWTPSRWLGMLGGVVVAVVISGLPVAGEADAAWFLFLAGSVAICAMILPGISGAFVLLLLGAYHPVTGLIRDLVHGDVSVAAVVTLAAFAAGCLTGLLAFTKLLRWLLEHHRGTTMSALVGLMLGSISRLWPLQVPTPETADLEMKFRRYEYVPPGDWGGSLWGLALLAVAAAAAVLVIETWAAGRSRPGEAPSDWESPTPEND